MKLPDNIHYIEDELAEWKARAEKAEAERDEARANEKKVIAMYLEANQAAIDAEQGLLQRDDELLRVEVERDELKAEVERLKEYMMNHCIHGAYEDWEAQQGEGGK